MIQDGLCCLSRTLAVAAEKACVEVRPVNLSGGTNGRGQNAAASLPVSVVSPQPWRPQTLVSPRGRRKLVPRKPIHLSGSFSFDLFVRVARAALAPQTYRHGMALAGKSPLAMAHFRASCAAGRRGRGRECSQATITRRKEAACPSPSCLPHLTFSTDQSNNK